ncbi:hypothetical protein HDU93_004542 [Gonapodya sp. JEL0774]|nr:hypothetical protein HDU93_004542 [Gonapodya sp. JEL0774]
MEIVQLAWSSLKNAQKSTYAQFAHPTLSLLSILMASLASSQVSSSKPFSLLTSSKSSAVGAGTKGERSYSVDGSTTYVEVVEGMEKDTARRAVRSPRTGGQPEDADEETEDDEDSDSSEGVGEGVLERDLERRMEVGGEHGLLSTGVTGRDTGTMASSSSLLRRDEHSESANES